MTLKPFAIVRVARLHDGEHYDGWHLNRRPPQAGDLGTVVEVLGSMNDAQSYVVECPSGEDTLWLSEFSLEELSVLSASEETRGSRALSFRPRPLTVLLAKAGPHAPRFSAALENLSPGLSANLSELATAPPERQRAAITCCLSFACQAENFANIELGRAGLLAVPKSVAQAHLDEAARATLNLSDEWEFRRLLELLFFIDAALFTRFAQAGISSLYAEVREAAEDLLALASSDRSG